MSEAVENVTAPAVPVKKKRTYTPEQLARKKEREKHRVYTPEQKARIKAYHQEWYKSNRERINANNRAWFQANREKAREYVRKWQRKHKGEPGWRDRNIERHRAMVRQWHVNNHERSLELSRLNYAATKEHSKKVKKQWRQNNPVNVRQLARKRRAITQNAPIGDIKLIEQWEKLYRSLEEVRCYYCLGVFPPKECHSEHIFPLCIDGSHDISNLAIACAKCNLTKEKMSLARWNTFLNSPVLLL